VAPTVVAPTVTHPTAAERRATVARRTAKLKAARATARLRAQRAAARATARLRAQRAAAQKEVSAPVTDPSSSSSSSALPYLLTAFGAALLLLGLALTPAWAVPWSRASRVLEDRRDELGVIGAMSLVATVVFFLLVQVTK